MPKCSPNKLENGHCVGSEASRGLGGGWISAGGCWRMLDLFLCCRDDDVSDSVPETFVGPAVARGAKSEVRYFTQWMTLPSLMTSNRWLRTTSRLHFVAKGLDSVEQAPHAQLLRFTPLALAGWRPGRGLLIFAGTPLAFAATPCSPTK